MRKEINPIVAVVVAVLLVAIAGFALWRFTGAKSSPTDERGIPLAPIEARPGANALGQLWKTGVQPPKTQNR